MSVTIQITWETVTYSIQMQEDVICWILQAQHHFVLLKRLKRMTTAEGISLHLLETHIPADVRIVG